MDCTMRATHFEIIVSNLKFINLYDVTIMILGNHNEIIKIFIFFIKKKDILYKLLCLGWFFVEFFLNNQIFLRNKFQSWHIFIFPPPTHTKMRLLFGREEGVSAIQLYSKLSKKEEKNHNFPLWWNWNVVQFFMIKLSTNLLRNPETLYWYIDNICTNKYFFPCKFWYFLL